MSWTATIRPRISAPIPSPTPGWTSPAWTSRTGRRGRWWTLYLNSNSVMRDYAAMRGVPAAPGRTTLDLDGDRLTATTYAGDRPIIRSTARVGSGIAETARGPICATSLPSMAG